MHGLVYVLHAKLSDHINYILLAVSIKIVLASSAVIHGFEPRSDQYSNFINAVKRQRNLRLARFVLYQHA
jgi:hypothetical protein